MTGRMMGLTGVFLSTVVLAALLAISAPAAEGWRGDFEEVCGKTDQAMSLSLPELKSLLERCARVEKALESEDESVRKVYQKRVQMCRNLYRFMVETKEQQK